MDSAPPAKATDAVLVASEPVPDGVQEVKGIDWAALPPHSAPSSQILFYK